MVKPSDIENGRRVSEYVLRQLQSLVQNEQKYKYMSICNTRLYVKSDLTGSEHPGL